MSYQEERKTKGGGNGAGRPVPSQTGGYSITPMSAGMNITNSHSQPQQHLPGPPQMMHNLAMPTNGRTDQSSQTLLTQLQSILTQTQQPNQVLLQRLQQLIQPNSTGLGTAGGTYTGPIATMAQLQAVQQPTFQSQSFQSGEGKDGKVLASDAGGTSVVKPDTGQQPIIVPCRARGVPSDHNASTAYFSIPHDIKHGTSLFCSHPDCRNEGVKFCYCSHCGIAVAKRNFRQRHNHGGEKKKKEESSKDKKCEPSGPLHRPAVQPAVNAAAQSAGQPDGLKKQVSASSTKKRRGRKKEKSSSRKHGKHGGKKHQRSSIRLPLLFQEDRKNVSNSSESEEVDITKNYRDVESRWNSLLLERPSEDITGDATSKWLLTVLEVSSHFDSSIIHENLPEEKTTLPGGNGFNMQCSEPSEENSSLGSSEGASSESSDSLEAGSSTDSNAYKKFVNQSQPVRHGAVRTYGVSTESSGPTDQSGGVSTSASNPTTSGCSGSSGSGTNSTGGSSSDSENGSKNDHDFHNPILQDLKRSSADGELTETHRPPVKKRKQNKAG